MPSWSASGWLCVRRACSASSSSYPAAARAFPSAVEDSCTSRYTAPGRGLLRLGEISAGRPMRVNPAVLDPEGSANRSRPCRLGGLPRDDRRLGRG